MPIQSANGGAGGRNRTCRGIFGDSSLGGRGSVGCRAARGVLATYQQRIARLTALFLFYFFKNESGTVAFALDRGCCFPKRTSLQIGLDWIGVLDWIGCLSLFDFLPYLIGFSVLLRKPETGSGVLTG